MSTALPVSVQGLLIEGVDYAGKTAVADELARSMTRQGRLVRRRACFMHPHPIIDALLAIAKASDKMDVRDTCYTSSVLLDVTMPPIELPRGFLVQERHVPTQIARNTFFYDDPSRWQVEALLGLRRRFSHQVYLTSDLATKKRRTRARPPKSPRDALLASDPLLHQRFDDFSRSALPADEDWLIIDTSGFDIEQVGRQIFDHLERCETRACHASS